MEDLLGLLRIRVVRGVNLAIRDVRSSDPYVVVRLGKQKLKTRVIKKNINPEWDEELTLYVTDSTIPVKLQAYDKDVFMDDKMGDAEFDIKPFLEAQKKARQSVNISNGTVLDIIKPCRQNCFAEESCITYENGKVTQTMFLRLRNVERGEIVIKLEWVDVPGSKGLHT